MPCQTPCAALYGNLPAPCELPYKKKGYSLELWNYVGKKPYEIPFAICAKITLNKYLLTVVSRVANAMVEQINFTFHSVV